MRLVDYEIDLRAEMAVVYHHLTDAAALLTWIATDAVSEPAVGGQVRWVLPNGATMAGRYLELQPPRRLVFSYGWEGDLMGVPPESTVVEIDLEPIQDGCRLILRHRLLPDDAADLHRQGWDYFLRRLAARWETSGSRSAR